MAKPPNRTILSHRWFQATSESEPSGGAAGRRVVNSNSRPSVGNESAGLFWTVIPSVTQSIRCWTVAELICCRAFRVTVIPLSRSYQSACSLVQGPWLTRPAPIPRAGMRASGLFELPALIESEAERERRGNRAARGFPGAVYRSSTINGSSGFLVHQRNVHFVFVAPFQGYGPAIDSQGITVELSPGGEIHRQTLHGALHPIQRLDRYLLAARDDQSQDCPFDTRSLHIFQFVSRRGDRQGPVVVKFKRPGGVGDLRAVHQVVLRIDRPQPGET